MGITDEIVMSWKRLFRSNTIEMVLGYCEIIDQ
jgi:hypothetical protein